MATMFGTSGNDIEDFSLVNNELQDEDGPIAILPDTSRNDVEDITLVNNELQEENEPIACAIELSYVSCNRLALP